MKKKAKKNISVKPQGAKVFLALMAAVFIFAVIWLTGCKSRPSVTASSAADPAKDYNVVVPVNHDIGNLNAVPKQELDSLFGDLKK